jgi:sporulation protein YlmC with PRC-barrel domain
MRILTGAAALTAVLLTAAAQAHHRSPYINLDEESALIPYSSIVGARVEDNHGYTVGQVVNLKLTPKSHVRDVNVRLNRSDEIVSVPAGDMVLLRDPDDFRGTDTIQSSLDYREMRDLPQIESP